MVSCSDGIPPCSSLKGILRILLKSIIPWIDRCCRMRAIPGETRQQLCAAWSQGCEALMAPSSSFKLIKAIPQCTLASSHYLAHSVISFTVSRPNGILLSRDELKKVHEWLTFDLSKSLPNLSPSVSRCSFMAVWVHLANSSSW